MGGIPCFGEALAFYTRSREDGAKDEFVVYCPVVELCMQHRRWQGKWPEGRAIEVARVSSILAIVGILTGPRLKDVYILRKHPGLNLLSDVECGLTSGEVDQEVLDDMAADV